MNSDDLKIIFKTITFIIYIIGSWKLLEKLKERGFWSLIPFAREFHIAKSIDMEDESFIWAITQTASDFFLFMTYFFQAAGYENSLANTMLYILAIVFGVINFIYCIRIYRELCLTFGMRNRWIGDGYSLKPAQAYIGAYRPKLTLSEEVYY